MESTVRQGDSLQPGLIMTTHTNETPNYAKARKDVQARKPKSNYLLVEVAYDKKYILSYEDGIKLIAALEKAEQLSKEYGKPARIHGIKEPIECRAFPSIEYERIKLAALLQVDPESIPEEAFE